MKTTTTILMSILAAMICTTSFAAEKVSCKKSGKNCALASLHVAAALVIGLLGQLAVELAVLHFTTALVHLLPGYTTSNFLFGAKCGTCEDRKSNTNA